jgi:signal transduction histidine kinase
MKKNRSSDMMLMLAAYLTLGSVAVGTLISLSPEMNFMGILVVFVLIAVEFALQGKLQQMGHTWLYVILVTLTTTSLFFFNVSPGLFLVIFFVIAAQSMILLPSPWGGVWIGILAVISAITFVGGQGFQEGLLLILIYGGGYLFFGIFGKSLMDARLEREKSEQLYQELQVAHDQLQDYVLRAEELAATKERNRLAREMHDSLGHRLTVAAVQLEGAQRLIPQNPEKSAEMVGTVRGQVREALDELRQTVATLRQPIEVDLSLNTALERLALSFEETTGLEINLQVDEINTISSRTRHAVYRIVQEGLTNIQRHAQAKNAWVQVLVQGKTLSLLISDDGIGFPEEDALTGFGLRGLVERVHLLGGECHFENRQAGGAQISVKLPFQTEDTHE